MRLQLNSKWFAMIHARMLRYLDEVARTGSIRHAADKVNVSSSAINRQILDLEAELGTPIFHRMPRGVRLTSAGEILISHIRQTLKEYDRTRERMLDLQGLKAGHVTVAARSGLAQGLLTKAGLAFQAKFPRIKMTVRSLTAEQILSQVEAGDADLGLIYNLPPHHGLHVMEVFETPLGAVVSKDHPLANQASVRLSQCADYPIVLSDRWITVNRVLTTAFARAKLPFAPAFETNSIAMMKALVLDGRHVTFLGMADVRYSNEEDRLKHLPIKNAGIPSQPLALIHRTNATLGLAASLFAEDLRALLAKV